MLAVADGEDAPGLGLDLTQLMELLQARGTRLVEHDILAGPHRTDGHGRPLARNAGGIPPEKDLETIPPTGGARQELYLRLMTEQLTGWDNPRVMLAQALRENHFLLLAQ